MKCYLEPLTNYLYAVIYEGEEDNIYQIVQDQWHDAKYLHTFFNDDENKKDLADFWNRPINKGAIKLAIRDTIDDANYIDEIIDTDRIEEIRDFFHLLNNEESETSGPPLKREKGKGERRNKHNSWLRLYAIRVNDDPDNLQSNKIYVITGGAIKLTQEMKERVHTKAELQRINDVRDFLRSKGITDIDSLNDYINEEQ